MNFTCFDERFYLLIP